MIYVGIDPGTHTGVAVWNARTRELVEVTTLKVHRALVYVKELKETAGADGIFVVFEDARQRKWLQDKSVESLQGAGSIKRDCKIWEDFLKDEGIGYRAQSPLIGGTKLQTGYFERITGYKGRTSNHGRDAAMLVFGL